MDVVSNCKLMRRDTTLLDGPVLQTASASRLEGLRTPLTRKRDALRVDPHRSALVPQRVRGVFTNLAKKRSTRDAAGRERVIEVQRVPFMRLDF